MNVDVGTQARAHEPRAGRVRLPDRRAGLLLTVVGLPLLTGGPAAAAGTPRGRQLPADLPPRGRRRRGAWAGPARPCWRPSTSFLLVNWFLTPPYYTLAVANRDTTVELVVFILVAVLVSVAVEAGARARQAAERHAVESRLLSELGAVEIGDGSVTTVLERVQALFTMDAVALRHAVPG